MDTNIFRICPRCRERRNAGTWTWAGIGNYIALALADRQVDEVEVHRVFSGCLPAVGSRKQPTKPQGDLWDKTVVADTDQIVLSVLEE